MLLRPRLRLPCFRPVPVAVAWGVILLARPIDLCAGLSFQVDMGARQGNGLIWGLVLVDGLILAGLVILFLLNARMRKALDLGRREIHLQEKKFQAIFQNHRQLCGLLDADGRVVAINSQALHLIGCRQEDVQGRFFADTPWWTHSQTERARLRQAIAEIRDGRESSSFDTTHVDGKGKLHNIDFSLSPIRNGDGQLRYMLALGHDVTTLRHNRQLYHSFFDNTPDPVLLLRDGVIIDCNQKALHLFRATSDRLTGLEPSSLVEGNSREHAGNQRSIDDVMAEIIHTGVQTIEWQARRLDGTLFDGEFTMIPLHIGNTFYLQMVIKDVTREKETRRELVMAKYAFDHSALPIVWYVPGKTLRECRFFYANDSACRVTGYSREEFLQLSIADISQVWNEENFRQILDHIRSQGSETYETMIRHRDGHDIPMEVNTSYFKLDDQEYFFVIAEVISLRKQLEEELRQARKMEALGTLAGGIAHDFNNILSAIFGFTDLALHSVGRNSEPGRHMEQVRSAAERARLLVQQILTYSRKTREQCQPVRVAPAVGEALQLLRSTIPTSIGIESSLDSSGMVMADATRIQQVVMNLCTNGYHAMREQGGTLHVRVVDVDLAEQEAADIDLVPGSYVLISVSDTGVGMDEQTRERIFDPYFTTKEAGEGTGLGLAVVHGIVQSYGGAIRVTSQPGQGSLFEVFLPRIEGGQDRERPEATGQGPVDGRERIMFVDDEELIVNMSRQLLGRFGYTVIPFTSSREALAYFGEHAGEIDLVITDLTMPELNGLDLARRMIEIRPDLRVILCTGYSEEMNRDRILALGIARFVQKPLVMEEMLATVRAVLDE